MRQKRALITGFLFFFVLSLLPAHAGAWRSSTGNIFRFQTNGNLSYIGANGGSGNGRWWWYNQGSGVFQYQFYGDRNYYQVHMQNNNQAVVYGGRGGPSYWSRLGGRGGAEDKDTGAEKSGWFMVRETP